jgi:hypothetical protein
MIGFYNLLYELIVQFEKSICVFNVLIQWKLVLFRLQLTLNQAESAVFYLRKNLIFF